MCSKAEEIQNNHEIKIGDYFANAWYDPITKLFQKYDTHKFIVIPEFEKSKFHTVVPQWRFFVCNFKDGKTTEFYHSLARGIWLPRQEQLQDIVMLGYAIFGCDTIEHFMDDFHYFQEHNNPLFDSMEKLTFAFTMHHLYKKSWNGSEWIAEQEER